MRPFSVITSVAIPLIRDNIDTDAIIPSREMKSVSKTGLAGGLFAGWRYLTLGGRDPDPDFVLNHAEYADATILLGGANFGCGSSREHAPWALMDFGIRCVISTSFADIFYNNCFSNGLLPVILKAEEVHALMAEAKGGNHVFSVDLEAQTVTAPSGQAFSFEIDAGRKEKMLKGLDAIGETLEHASAIDRFEERRRMTRTWASA